MWRAVRVASIAAFQFTAALGSALMISAPAARSEPLRLMVNRASAVLNPRQAGDAVSQRLNSLIFRGLTRIDAELEPRPDLASGWQVLDGGKTWKFDIAPDARDHDGAPITAEGLARCLDQYRQGKPSSVYRSSFPGWRATESAPGAVLVRLEHPSPYLARNLSMLRYFRVEGEDVPCAEPPAGRRVIASGMYRPVPWNPAPESSLSLEPVQPMAGDRKALEVLLVGDDNALALKLLRGEADVAQNTIPLSKSNWLKREHAGRFETIEREGVVVSYLAFNLRDPILAKRQVRQAIALAIDRESIVRNKMFGFGTVAGSLLSPRLPESASFPFAFDPARSEALLDAAGYPRPGPGRTRFELKYRTTPVREGFETGLMFQNMLAKVGIRLVIEPVEPAVFLAAIRRGAFQLHSSRWVGISDGSILHRTLRSGQQDNRAGYRDVEMDTVLDRAIAEGDPARRTSLMQRAQELMARDLPYFPLWYWSNLVIARKGLRGLRPGDLSLSGGYEPLTRLR